MIIMLVTKHSRISFSANRRGEFGLRGEEGNRVKVDPKMLIFRQFYFILFPFLSIQIDHKVPMVHFVFCVGIFFSIFLST